MSTFDVNEMKNDLLYDLSEEEVEEIFESDSWEYLADAYKEDGCSTINFIVYDSAEDFGASDPDNDNRSEDDTDEEWADFLYEAILQSGGFIYRFKCSGRYLVVGR